MAYVKSKEELENLIEDYLASPKEREEKGRRGRELVLKHHTFEHRIEDLLHWVTKVSREDDVRARVRTLA